jgi:hypothetical protein
MILEKPENRTYDGLILLAAPNALADEVDGQLFANERWLPVPSGKEFTSTPICMGARAARRRRRNSRAVAYSTSAGMRGRTRDRSRPEMRQLEERRAVNARIPHPLFLDQY